MSLVMCNNAHALPHANRTRVTNARSYNMCST